MKKTTKLTILLAVLLSMANNKTFAYDIAVENADGVTIYYNVINSGNELEVTYLNYNYGNNTYPGAIVIPEEVTYDNKTRKVTSIGEFAFCYSGVTSVTIPNNVTSIGDNAFWGNADLSSVTIPKNVQSIGKKVFANCSNLESINVDKNNNSFVSDNGILFDKGKTVIICYPPSKAGTEYTIPNSVQRVDDGAFYFSNLSSIIIPSSVTSIGERAFSSCEYLSTITIPESVTSIGINTFEFSLGLTSVTIDNGVTSVSNYMFSNCWNLTSVSIPNSVTSIGNGAFSGCRSITSLIIPNSVTEIGFSAFSGCSSLTSFTIPVSVTRIGNSAFSGCTGLTEVFSLIEKPSAISSYVWSDVNTSSIPLYVPAASKSLYKATEGWNVFDNIVGFVSINEETFPDDNFRNWVLEQDYGRDGVLTDEEIANVWTIDVSFINITNMKGIEYFTKMTSLTCYGNQLTSLDVSQNTALWTLRCSGNQLTSLDLSNNTELGILECNGNLLTSLNFSKNTKLTALLCSANQINETEMGKLVESLPTPSYDGTFIVKVLENSEEHNVITTAQVAAARAKGWTVFAYVKNGNIVEYDGDEPQGISPVDEGEVIGIGTEIDENTNLDGNVVDNVYFNINDGSYDASGGCIVVNSPTDDSFINGQDIFGDDFKEGYNGIVFMVPAGKGTIKVEAQTTGNMVLKVKIGDNDPIEMELEGKLKMSFPYNVSEDTYVYIYGGEKSASAKGMRKASGSGSLKIYGIEVVSGENGIEYNNREPITNNRYYNLNGQKVNGMPTKKGVYIKDGKKVLVK